MKVLLIGGYGLLGTDIYKELVSRNDEVFRFKRNELDIMDKENLKKKIDEIEPELIINAAGYTNVSKSEEEFESAFDINCIGTYNLVYAMNKSKASLISFSTDYIFDGNKEYEYTEQDRACPINKYGWTKLVSEDIIRQHYKRHYIIRTSWLFGVNGRCFPKIILEKLENGDEITVVNDQIGTPTYTYDLAKSIKKIINMPYGTYNITNEGETNWFEYARLIAEYFDYDKNQIVPIKSSEYETKVLRPEYSVLNNNKWLMYGEKLRNYKDALKEFCIVLKNS